MVITIIIHYLHAASSEEGAFLARGTEPVFTALGSLFGLALEFTELHDQARDCCNCANRCRLQQ